MPVLEILYERAYKEPGIIENGEWETILEERISGEGFSGRFQRLRVDIGLFKKGRDSDGKSAQPVADSRPREKDNRSSLTSQESALMAIEALDIGMLTQLVEQAV